MDSGIKDRAASYRLAAKELLTAAQQATSVAVMGELEWLAQSYERLAEQIEQGEEHLAVRDGHRSLKIADRPNKFH
jgi:hypothetical protein